MFPDKAAFAATPTLTSLSPSSGTTAGGNLLTFTGTNFSGTASVIFPDGSPATNVTIVNPTTVTAIAPAQTGGDVSGGTVSLIINDGVTVTDLSATYTYVQPPAPTLTSLSPNSGTTAGGNLLTFTGTNFAGIPTVTFPDGSPATNVTLVNSTTITAIAPAQTAGDVGGGTVTLSLKEGVTTISFNATYTYVTPPPPTLTSLSPNSGTTVGGNLLTFTGTNFAGIVSVTFPDGSPATNVTLVNSTTITAIAPAQTAGDVGGGTVTLSLKQGILITSLSTTYTYVTPPPPTLTSLSPNSGATAGGTLLTFTGTNFAGIATVTFPDGSPATSVTIVNATTITAIAPAQTAGDVGGGTVTLSLREGTTITNLTATYTYVHTVATNTSLISSANPVAAGAPVTFTATVASGSGTPSGTINFKDGATSIGSVVLAGGAASLTTSFMVGTHVITAVYGGSSGFTSSTSAALTETVNVSQDSLKLRALQIVATKVEADNSGAAITDAVDNAISDGFNDGGNLITPGAGGIRFNFSADQDRPQASNTDGTVSDRWGGLPGNADSYQSSRTTPGTSRVDDAFAAINRQAPTKAPPLHYTEPKDWLLWADVKGSGIDRSGSSTATPQLLYGSQVNALLGLTHRITSTFLVGMLGGYETFDYRSDALNGRLKGDGWTVGSYLGWKFAPGLRFDMAAAYSGIGYDGVAGLATGDFGGRRWLLSTGLIGTYKTYGFDIEPSAKVYALWERENAYTDSLGALQADRNFFTGRASAGAKVSYPWLYSATVTLAPYVGLYGDYYFESDDAAAVPLAGAAALASVPLLEGWSMRATGGLAAHFANGTAVAVGAEFGGIGSSTQIWTFRGRASVPF